MKLELGEKTHDLSLEAREKAMKEQLRRHGRGIRSQDRSLAPAEKALSDNRASWNQH